MPPARDAEPMGRETETPMRVITEIREMQQASRRAQREGKRVGFVPTMGALHEGHLSLVRAARRACDWVVVSIFVNPLQFGPKEDFARYPRDMERDQRLCADAGTDVLFAPSVKEMIPAGIETHVEVAKVTKPLEGRCRPGHFRGVATIVTKLFNAVLPDVAYFGQKDAQQAQVIRRMTADLNMPVTIQTLPTVREPDGLAMSSRNAYLRAAERTRARCLHRALKAAEDLVRGGERRPAALRRAMLQVLRGTPGARVEYAAVVDPATFRTARTVREGSLLVLAVRIGKTRLIDNAILSTGGA